MKRIRKVIVLLVLIGLAALSCDTGLGLMTTRITGQVIFHNPDKKPDYVESVQVVVASRSLFESPSLDDVILADRPVNLSQQKASYEVFVPPGTYPMIAAIYKKKGQDWNYLNILGVYGFDPLTYTFYDTDPVVIGDKHKVASGYDIICDWRFIGSQANRP